MELVAELVEVAHTDLTEVSRMVLVEEDAVVVHASGITTTTRMLAVLSDTTVTGADVAPLLPVLLEPGRHGWTRVLGRVGAREAAGGNGAELDLGFGLQNIFYR